MELWPNDFSEVTKLMEAVQERIKSTFSGELKLVYESPDNIMGDAMLGMGSLPDLPAFWTFSIMLIQLERGWLWGFIPHKTIKSKVIFSVRGDLSRAQVFDSGVKEMITDELQKRGFSAILKS